MEIKICLLKKAFIFHEKYKKISKIRTYFFRLARKVSIFKKNHGKSAKTKENEK